MTELLLNQTLFSDLAVTLLHFIWQGTLIGLSLKIALKVTPDNNAQLRYLLSCIAMIACLVFPIVTFQLLQHVDISAFAQAIFNAEPSLGIIAPAPEVSVPWYQFSFLDANLLPVITMAWFSIVLLLMCRLLIELFTVNQLRKRNVFNPSAELAQKFSRLSEQLMLTRAPKLLISSATSVPMAIGWLKPVVLIPCSMLSGLTPNQLDMLILHELAHIKRHDYAVNLLQTVVETLLFFHPAVHWISKQMRNEREYCSDDIAVSHCGNPMAYARTLTDTANHCLQHRHHTIPTMAVAASGGDLKQRISRLVTQQHCNVQSSSIKWFSVLLVISTLSVATAQALYFEAPIEQTKKKKLAENVYNSDAQITTTLLSPFELEAKDFFTELTNSNLLSVNDLSTRFAIADSEKQFNNKPLSINTASISNAEKNLRRLRTADLGLNIDDQEVLAVFNLYKNQSETKNNTVNVDKHLRPPTLEIGFFDAFNLYDKQSTKEIVQTSPAKKISKTSLEAVNQTTNLAPSLSAKLLQSQEPFYPPFAKQMGLEGDVRIEFIIGTDGLVKDVQFKSSEKTKTFKNAIRSAMKKWRFEPARVDGKAVESTMSKVFSFNLAA